MALRKVLAREFTVEVQDEDSVYVAIGGLINIGFDNGKQDADTTDFDSEGFAEHMVAERNSAITLEGRWLEDDDYGARDPGQEQVELLASRVGADSHGTFRLTSPGGNTKTFAASVQVSGPGGGTNDATAWQATLTVSGKQT